MRENEKKKAQRIARTRIDALFEQAAALKPFNQSVADRYVHLAWNLSTKHKIRMSLAHKRSFCRKCKTFWRHGVTVRMRIVKGRKIYTCLVCKTIKRVPFK